MRGNELAAGLTVGTRDRTGWLSAHADDGNFGRGRIGGAVGGTLTGLYAARNRRHRRDLRQQANRLILLNRLLRDKVINSATAIKGHADVLSADHRAESVEVVGEQADSVIETVENVKYLAETGDKSDQTLGSVDVIECLNTEIEAVQERFPNAEFDCETPDEEIRVRATAQLSEVFRHLLTNAAQYSDGQPRVSAAVDLAPNHVTIQIADDGPGLPAEQRSLLEAGEIAEFDDPTTGFGLNIVRLLIESYEGEIKTAVDETGTTVSIRLPREQAEAGAHATSRAITAPGVSPPQIALAVVASLVAGVVMGAGMVATGGNMPIIGALYGIRDPLVAVISHEFHSVVFGLVYAGVLSTLPANAVRRFRMQMAIAVGLGLVLWFFAAGVVMPLWLGLLGIDAAVPMVTVPSLIGHLLWALSLGTLYYYGDRWLAAKTTPDGRHPHLDRLSQRILGE